MGKGKKKNDVNIKIINFSEMKASSKQEEIIGRLTALLQLAETGAIDNFVFAGLSGDTVIVSAMDECPVMENIALASVLNNAINSDANLPLCYIDEIIVPDEDDDE
jgi:hypothetical protein